jgi:serine phosphatase RsbU (regulator of sigma subunit)
MIKSIRADISTFTGDTEQSDDITMVAVKLL